MVEQEAGKASGVTGCYICFQMLQHVKKIVKSASLL